MKKILSLVIIIGFFCGCNPDCVTKMPNKEGNRQISNLFTTDIDDADMVFDVSVFVVYHRTKPAMSEVSRDLDKSVAEANSFSDKIKFKVVSSKYVKHNAVLANIRQSKKMEDDLCTTNDVEGTINLYIVRTDNDLEGYTPVLQNNFEEYPTLEGMERVFVSYGGLSDGAVFIHELGHFFGLGHTNECRNYMSYNCYRDTFDAGQRATISRFAKVYRSYLYQ